MDFVQPIRDKDKIEEMKNELLRNGQRDYLLFVVGINTGLRVSDILSLKVKDVKNKSHICIREQKTNKERRFMINPQLEQSINKFIFGMDPEQFLFESRGSARPITRIQAYRILSHAADMIGLESIGTHTMRKTFGYWHYKTHKDVAVLQDIFNHGSPSVTLRYIGINDDIKDETIKNFYL